VVCRRAEYDLSRGLLRYISHLNVVMYGIIGRRGQKGQQHISGGSYGTYPMEGEDCGVVVVGAPRHDLPPARSISSRTSASSSASHEFMSAHLDWPARGYYRVQCKSVKKDILDRSSSPNPTRA
jgi:hypothetical protein